MQTATSFFTLATTALLIGLGSQAQAADNVSVSINGQTYTCSLGGSGGGAKDCTIARYGSTDKYGTTCGSWTGAYSNSQSCAFVYQYGAMLTSTYSSSNESLANWCNERLAK